MSQWQPCKRRVFIRRLRQLGFDGPYSGTRHQFMVYSNHRMSIPSDLEYSVPKLRMMLNEAETIIDRSISSDEWNGLAKLIDNVSDNGENMKIYLPAKHHGDPEAIVDVSCDMSPAFIKGVVENLPSNHL